MAHEEINFNAAISQLQRTPKVQKLLFAEISKADGNVKDSAKDIIEYLVKIPIPKLLKIISLIQQENINDHTIRRDLGILVRNLLPSLYGADWITQIRNNRFNANVLEIPYATDISAEILMAGADKRPADFKIVQLDHGKKLRPGKYRLALPPESGSEQISQLQAVDDDLSNRISNGINFSDIHLAVDEELFKNNLRKQGRPYTMEDKRRLNQRWLEKEAQENKPGFYWFFFMSADEKERERFQKFTADIRQSYPYITILALESDFERQDEEDDLFFSLAGTQFPD